MPQKSTHPADMPSFARRPCPALAPWVQLLWATTDDEATAPSPYVERVLPTGAMHVVLRLSDAPLTLFEGARAEQPLVVGHSVVGGVRSTCYVKRAGEGGCSVGVQLQPGAALALLGAPARELAGCHTPLDPLWGSETLQLREQLHAVRERALFAAHGAISSDAIIRAQVEHMESFLLSRLGRSEAQVDWWLNRAVTALEAGELLDEIVAASGVSHRTFITRFDRAVGLTPKLFSRVRRFQRVIEVLGRAPLASDAAARGAVTRIERSTESLARVALDAGYADQSHLSRDFLQFAGVSPSAYLRLAPTAANHLPVRP